MPFAGCDNPRFRIPESFTVSGQNQFSSSWGLTRLATFLYHNLPAAELRGEFEVRLLLANRVRSQVATTSAHHHSEAGITSGTNTSWTGHVRLNNNNNSPWVNLVNNSATFRGVFFHC